MTKTFMQQTNLVELESLIMRTFVGIPYQYKGRSLKTLDCWGLFILLYGQLGVELFDIPSVDYSDEEWSKKGGNFLAENSWRDWDKLEHGTFLDAVLFRNAEGVSHHCGVMLLDGRFIHCGKHGVQIGRMDEKWKNLVGGYYRLRKLHE